ncbi:NrsF family protein [Parvularcula lutaonensis]|uniref:NrsF family protein n=1 Tax=Parvularcula lutaonensis TaxID=491923 RepID=A0ABV7M851_9PROT|nr:DUF1109 domain-containing protein [Parvularcula lutaonensis]GGY43444.1 hypothetical protein GCM10007148_10260 [Parvularcula lutaonensis]
MREHQTSSSTQSLIDGLTESMAPVARRNPRREALVLGGILFLQLAGTIALMGTNAVAVFTHDFWGSAAKAVMFAGFALGFALLAFRSFDPTAPRQKNLAIAMAGALVGFGVLTLDRNFGGGALNVLRPANGIQCLISSISFAIPMFIALTVFMRGAAPTQPRMTALFIGIASGAWGTFIYALQCPFTNIGYLAAWYGGAIAITTLVAAVLLPRLARW